MSREGVGMSIPGTGHCSCERLEVGKHKGMEASVAGAEQVGQKLTGTSTQLQEGSGQVGPVRLHEGCAEQHTLEDLL